MAGAKDKPRPAGAPDDWDERAPAGAPLQPAAESAEAEAPPEEPSGDETPAGDAPAQEGPSSDGTRSPDGGDEVAEELEQLVSDLRRERDEYLGLAQRAQADFENYRKRAARDASEAERRGRAAVARELVPSIDNLERALAAAGVSPGERPPAESAVEAPSEEVSAHEALARGVALVYGELQGALARAGVESFDPLGERFDPQTCEAISTRAAGDDEPGTVIETLERGYRLDGQVLRPARVVVAE